MPSVNSSKPIPLEFVELRSKNSPKFPPSATFKPFSWLREDCQTTDTGILSLAKDIAAGVKLSLELIEKAGLEAEGADEDAPAYLNANHIGILQRFAIASCDTLDSVIERRFDYLNSRSMKEAGDE